MTTKNIALGIDDFKIVVDGNYALVDKTLMIKEFFQTGAYVTLAPRPRRFGKTLNLSMLRYFCEKTSISQRYLFEGLKVSQYPEIMAHQGQYPVIFITFKDIKVKTWEECYQHLKNVISQEYKRHEYLIDTPLLGQHQKIIYQSIIDKNADKVEYESSLFNLSRYLNDYHNKPAIILIDEYDTPIHAGYNNHYYADVMSFIRNLMCACLKGNSSLHKGFVTGILRIAKESIFSGLNNLMVCTFTTSTGKTSITSTIDGQVIQQDTLYTDKFGFLEDEVVELAHKLGISISIKDIRDWYNGYGSGKFSVYNPWSIINYLQYKELKPYWVNTSDNELIKTVTRAASAEAKSDLATIFQGGVVVKDIAEDIVFQHLLGSDKALWSFLLNSGYLTFTVPEERDSATTFGLRLPNNELRTFFPDMIQSWFATEYDYDPITPMLTSLVSGDIETFKERFEHLVSNCFSYLDVTNQYPERFYHAFMLGMIAGLEKTYFITSNREAGIGRYDLLLEPRNPAGIGFIIELKKFSKKLDQTLDDTAKRAMAQIEEKKYEQALVQRGIKDIRKLAIVFRGKESLIKE